MFELAAATSSDPGFIAQSWQILQTYWPMFLRGAGVTLLIAITGTLTGDWSNHWYDPYHSRKPYRFQAEKRAF